MILISAGVPMGSAAAGLRILGWPAIFLLGGVLPLAMVPPLAL
jgi:hypothetical protein